MRLGLRLVCDWFATGFATVIPSRPRWPAPTRLAVCAPAPFHARHLARARDVHDEPAIDSDIMGQGTLPLGLMCKLRTTLPHTTSALLPPCCRSDGAVQLATAQTEMTPRATSRARTRESLHMTILQPQSIPVRAKKTPIAVTHTPRSTSARAPNLNVDADGAKRRTEMVVFFATVHLAPKNRQH